MTTGLLSPAQVDVRPLMVERTWGTPLAAMICGVHRQTLEYWIQEELVPIFGANKRERRINVRGLLCIGIVDVLRRKKGSDGKKIPNETIRDLTEFLERISTDELFDSFCQGRYVLHGAGRILPAALYSPLDQPRNNTGVKAYLVSMDLLACFATISERIEHLDRTMDDEDGRAEDIPQEETK